MNEKQKSTLWNMTSQAAAIVFAAIVLIVGHAGYNIITRPGTGDALKALQPEGSEQYKSNFKVLSVTKLDGQSTELMGLKHYSMIVHAIGEITKDDEEPTGQKQSRYQRYGFWGMQTREIVTAIEWRQWKKGTQCACDGSVEWVKTEKKWNPTAKCFFSPVKEMPVTVWKQTAAAQEQEHKEADSKGKKAQKAGTQ
ncbi:MAG: hypothetical protein HQL08_00490 [Nitrospirae bacterium]|nr:hypothetical protein [Nitrospirota bacterium]